MIVTFLALAVFTIDCDRRLYRGLIGSDDFACVFTLYEESPDLISVGAINKDNTGKVFGLREEIIRLKLTCGEGVLDIDLKEKRLLPLTVFQKHIFEICDETSDCFLKNLLFLKDVGSSIIISGKGVNGDTYFNSSVLSMDVGPVEDDGRFRAFNLPVFISEEPNVRTGGGLVTVTKEEPSVISDSGGDTHALLYSSPIRRLQRDNVISIELIRFEGFKASSTLMYMACGKTKHNGICDRLSFHTPPYAPAHDMYKFNVLHYGEITYWEISGYEIKEGDNSLHFKQNFFAPMLTREELFGHRRELSCSKTSEVKCSLIACKLDTDDCSNYGEMFEVKVVVRGVDVNVALINLNGRVLLVTCENKPNEKVCTAYVDLPVARNHELAYGERTVTLAEGKIAAFDIFSSSSGYIKVLMKRGE